MESVAIPQKLKRVIHALRQARSGITLMNRNRRGSKLNTARWQHIESMEQRQLLTNLVSLFVSDPLASETEPETPPDTGTFTINRTGTAADMAAEGAQKEGAQKVSEGAQKEREHKRGSTKGVRNRLLTSERDLGMLATWEDQNDQLRAVGFIMC